MKQPNKTKFKYKRPIVNKEKSNTTGLHQRDIDEVVNQDLDNRELIKKGFVANPASNAYKYKNPSNQQPELTSEKRTETGKLLDTYKGNQKEYRRKVKENVIKPLDIVSDIAQFGNFIPHPAAQAVARVGNVVGSVVDGVQAMDDFSNKNYTDAAINTASVALPSYLGSKGFRRSNKYLKPGQVLHPFKPKSTGTSTKGRTTYIEPFHKVNGMTNKSLTANRALLGALTTETFLDLQEDKKKQPTPKLKYGGNITENMRNPNKKKVPKALYGAAISAGVGVLSSVYSSIQANKEAKKAKRAAYDNTMREGDMVQQDYLLDYNQNLQDDLPVYALGGDIPNTNTPSTTGKYDTVGGELNPISSSADVVQGNTHKEKTIDNSYGVTLLDKGEPVVNVEDKEVIVDNDMVFSDKLKKGKSTYADIAFATNSKIGELEKSINSTSSPAEKFSAERTIEGLKRSNIELFAQQELAKANTTDGDDTVDVVDNSVPVAQLGTRIPNRYKGPYSTIEDDPSYQDKTDDVYASIPERKDTMAQDLIPMLADNLGNAIMTNTAPKPARPTKRVAPMVDTRINANPALADINSTIQSNNSIIQGNTSNSAVARSSMTANNLKGASARGNILAQKEAQERTLRNAQSAAVADNYNVNAEQTDDYNDAVLDRSLQINSANSKNINNVMSNINAVKQKELEQRKDDDIFMLDLMDDQTGDKKRVFDRLGRPLYKGARDANTRENKRLGRKRI